MREAAGRYHFPFRCCQSFVEPWQIPTWMTFWREQPRLCHIRRFLPLWSARRKVFPVSPNCRHTCHVWCWTGGGLGHAIQPTWLAGDRKACKPKFCNQPPLANKRSQVITCAWVVDRIIPNNKAGGLLGVCGLFYHPKDGWNSVLGT